MRCKASIWLFKLQVWREFRSTHVAGPCENKCVATWQTCRTHTSPTADRDDSPYILKRGALGGFTRWQAFLIGVLPCCFLMATVMAVVSMSSGWSNVGFSGMLLGLAGSIGVGAFAAGGLGLVIWAIENSKRMAWLYVISASGVIVVFVCGGISIHVFLLYAAAVVLSWLYELMRQKKRRDSAAESLEE